MTFLEGRRVRRGHHLSGSERSSRAEYWYALYCKLGTHGKVGAEVGQSAENVRREIMKYGYATRGAGGKYEPTIRERLTRVEAQLDTLLGAHDAITD